VSGSTLERTHVRSQVGTAEALEPAWEDLAWSVLAGGHGPADGQEERREHPYAWVLPALPAEVARVTAAIELRQRERSRSSWWRRAAAARLSELDREMAAVRELRELATAVLDRRGGNRYGAVVPVSEVLLLLADPAGWRELIALADLEAAV
jgi:hypothetical protein